MKKTSRAFAWRFCIALAVALGGCAQVLGIDGWTDSGGGGQGGEAGSSSAQGVVGSSASAGGQSTVASSASAGGQSTVASSASAGGQSTVASSSAASSGQTSVSSTGSGNCKPEGVACQDPAECCTGACNNGVCTGCLALGTGCAGGGCCPDLTCGAPWKCCRHQGSCNSPEDCCSNTCFNGNCGITCTDEGLACTAHEECCPGLVCKTNVCALSCAAEAQPCMLNADCCVNLECMNGMCSPTCTPLWKPCASALDCCPGLACPAGLCTANIPDQYESEPNGDTIKANLVVPGKVCGAINQSGDHDWFAIVLPGGVNLTATVVAGFSDTCGPMGAIDSQLEIRIPINQLAFNDNISGTNLCSSATTAIGLPGTYYVHVAASPSVPGATFSYCLTLTVSD